MANQQEISVPDIGDFSDVDVIEVLVKEGDHVAVEDALITLETDKAAMDVPASAAGVVVKLHVSAGDKVSEGDPILTLETGVETRPDAAATTVGDKPEPEPAADRQRLNVVVPDIGDFGDVEIIEVIVKAGDPVATDDPLITLESDKAAMDVPAPGSGTVESVAVAVGDRVSEGDPILVLLSDAGGEPAAAKPLPAASLPPESPATDTGPTVTKKIAAPGRLPSIDETTFASAHASPAVRMFARELGVDLASVTGTGDKRRVTKDDVKAYVKSVLTGAAPHPAGGAGLPSIPEVDFARFGEIESKPLTRIQKIAGPRLQASWVNLPHVTQHDEADITELEVRRKLLKVRAAEQNIKLTPLAFVIKACVIALGEFPQVNSSLDPDGEHLILKKYFHIGFAVDTEDGLVVPVLKNADKKNLFEIAAGLAELSGRARESKLKANDIQGGSFTVSSLGSIGGTFFTPIINAPEVAILGVSRSRAQPVFIDGKFKARMMLPLSLSYDHRVIDGAQAVRFTSFLSRTLSAVDQLTGGLE